VKSAPPPPAPPVPVASIHGCTDAAAALERATRDVRPPEESVLAALKERCVADAWSQKAVDCFATMREHEVGPCAKLLDDDAATELVRVVGGANRTEVSDVRFKLSQLKVGVAECDRFVAAVSTIMSCEKMPLEDRLSLGNETADFWSLPTTGLSIDIERRMTQACGESLQALQRQAIDVGCML
jgi:hypothetical protein